MEQRKKIALGVDDFKELTSSGSYYVDKSLLIKEFLDSGAAVTLIPRPRRFGKTLNLSMLRYFFEKVDCARILREPQDERNNGEPLQKNANAHLFDGLAITKHPDAMAHQGQYPVIFFTLKFIDGTTWESCFKSLRETIAGIFKQYLYLLDGPLLSEREKKDFLAIVDLSADSVKYEFSLKNLTHYLAAYHNKKPLVFIDEYDVPINGGFVHGYYDDVAAFMRAFFGHALKGNEFLGRGMMTGCLRVAKESIFTGLNNLLVCTLLSNNYADKFGLLEDEVAQVLKTYDLWGDMDAVRRWYNGYASGKYKVYNPWSIINFAQENGTLKPYWINTSSNDIVKKLIQRSNEGVKQDIETLIAGGSICKELCENIVYADVAINSNALWNFLFFSGYLTINKQSMIGVTAYVDLCIPNNEVLSFYQATIRAWFEEQADGGRYNVMLASLVGGDIATFRKLFTNFVVSSFSYFDVSGKEPERFYHAFVLGMLASLTSTHEIKSNRESGYGRYDVMLIPHDKAKPGIIIEFKKVDEYENETLETAADAALAQIEEKKYATELKSRGVRDVVAVAIVFEGKVVLVRRG